MISSVLGLVCGIFIVSNVFGWHTLSHAGEFFCWCGIIIDSSSRIGINHYQKKDEE